MKIVDFILLTGIAVISFWYYPTDRFYNSAFGFASIIYTMIRKRNDVNVITLCWIIIVFKLLDSAIMSAVDCFSGLVYYPLMGSLNFVELLVVWSRPLIFSQIGPFKHRKGWDMTNADDAIGLILIIMVFYDVLLTIEHGIRRISPYYFENARWLYNHYEIFQMSFSLLSIAILLGIITTKSATDKSKFRG